MNAANLLNIIVAINQLLSLLKQEGIGWADLRKRIDKAHSEGREFDATDILLLQLKDDAERDALDAAIAAAKAPKP